VKTKKFTEAQAELEKAAQIDPPNAGRYFYNLGAVLVNTGQTEPAEIFKAFQNGVPYVRATGMTLTLLSPAMGDSASKTLADRLFTSTDACVGTISTVSETG
jgi:hypothetical protein